MIEAGSVIVGIIIFAIGQYFIVGFTIDFVELLKYSKFLFIIKSWPWFHVVWLATVWASLLELFLKTVTRLQD